MKPEKKVSKPKSLPPAIYWEWRTTMEEMQHAETKKCLAEQHLLVLQLNSEVAKNKAVLFQGEVHKAKDKAELLKKDYHSYVERIELDLGFSMKNVAVHPVSFEIIEL